MIIDARRGAHPSRIDCDLCIVGAGAAGLTVALELAESPLSICMLESGGLRPDWSLQSMLAGETGDSDYPPLHTVRVASIGGSMRLWAGWCRPLDAIDFEEREAVPNGGWPLGLDQLGPYYARAHDLLDLGPFDYDPGNWEGAGGGPRLPLDKHGFSSVLFRQSAVDLGVTLRDAIIRTERIRVLLHANVLRLQFSQDCKTVIGVEAATLNKRRFEVCARTFVVAAGGIETPRLLLLSSDKPRGPGNRHDLVGRYFTEHGYDSSKFYVPADPRRTLRFYFPEAVSNRGERRVARGAFAPTPDTLRREGLLNCAMYFRPAHESHPVFVDLRVQAGLELWEMLRSRAVPDGRLRKAIHGLSAPHAIALALWRRLDRREHATEKLRLLTLFECAPDPDNRVVLGTERDALGRRVARLQWRLRESERRSVAHAYRLFDAGLRSARLGHLEPISFAHGETRGPKGTVGEHHLGTTRMHREPTRGVVDENARVHGVDNLFIAGGSVFTSGGYANPTLTVVALASRLAAHLRNHVARSN